MSGDGMIPEGWRRLWILGSIVWALIAGFYWQGSFDEASRAVDVRLQELAQEYRAAYRNPDAPWVAERQRRDRRAIIADWRRERVQLRIRAAGWMVLPPILALFLALGSQWVGEGFRADKRGGRA